MKHVIPHFGPTDNTEYWKLYTTTQDTTIMNESYRLLYMNKLCQDFYSPNNVPVFNDEFLYNDFAIGGLRQDSQRLYFFKFTLPFADPNQMDQGYLGLDPEAEYIIYDFNFEIEDTVQFTTTYWIEIINNDSIFHEEPHFTIIRSDAGLINGAQSYNVSPNTAFAFPWEEGLWIEGIGSGYGLFGSYNSFLNYLICYKENGITQYGNQCEPCEGLATSLDLLDESSMLNLFPNPVYSHVTLEMLNAPALVSVQIINSNGVVQKEYEIGRQEIRYQFNMEAITPGIHFLRLTFDSGRIRTIKFMKI